MWLLSSLFCSRLHSSQSMLREQSAAKVSVDDTHHTLFSLWTKYTVAAIPGSFVFAMVFLPLYQLIAPLAGGKRDGHPL
jgi:hypothetical protein